MSREPTVPIEALTPWLTALVEVTVAVGRLESSLDRAAAGIRRDRRR